MISWRFTTSSFFIVSLLQKRNLHCKFWPILDVQYHCSFFPCPSFFWFIAGKKQTWNTNNAFSQLVHCQFVNAMISMFMIGHFYWLHYWTMKHVIIKSYKLCQIAFWFGSLKEEAQQGSTSAHSPQPVFLPFTCSNCFYCWDWNCYSNTCESFRHSPHTCIYCRAGGNKNSLIR